MPRVLAVAGGGGLSTTVATINPAFDRTSLRDFDVSVGDEYSLESSTSTVLRLGYAPTLTDPDKTDYWYHPGFDFTFATIPTAGTVTQVQFRITVTFQDGSGGNFDIAKASTAGTFAAESDPQNFWTKATGGTSYGTLTPSSAPTATYTVTLNATAVSDVQTLVTAGSGTLSIGLSETPALDVNDLRRFLSSVDAASNKPALLVTYTTTTATISSITRPRFPRIR